MGKGGAFSALACSSRFVPRERAEEFNKINTPAKTATVATTARARRNEGYAFIARYAPC